MPRKPHPAARDDPGFAHPAWEVVALAAAGLAIAGHLTVTKLLHTTPVLCGAGGSCDLVQASRYATLLGVPTAAWGAALYVVLGLLAARPLTRRRWRLTFVLAVAGVAFSGYMTAIALGVLRTACWWCLASAAIMTLLLVALVRRRPPPGPRWTSLQPARLAWLGGGVAVATVGVSVAIFAFTAPASPYQEALARHLSATGARFYGTFWCPACREQKRLFGNAASELPYVECDANGPGARPDLCAQASVRAYPTWVIQGNRHEGVTPLETLGRLSGFTPPKSPGS
jgi:uncharacterized membrane protein